MDNKTIAEQAREYSALLKNPPGGRISPEKMAEIIEFLRVNGATMAGMPHNETIAAGVFKLADALVEKGYEIRNLEDDGRYKN